MDCSTPGLPAHHQLPEFTQTHVHRVGNAIQPSHPLSSPSPPAFNLSQHQGVFQWVGSLHHVAKVLKFQLQLTKTQHSHQKKKKMRATDASSLWANILVALSLKRKASFPQTQLEESWGRRLMSLASVSRSHLRLKWLCVQERSDTRTESNLGHVSTLG